MTQTQTKRLEILDIGDQVSVPHRKASGVVVDAKQVGKKRLYSVHWHGEHVRRTHAEHGWERDQLMRDGGDLQRGDLVRVGDAAEDSDQVGLVLESLGLGMYDVCLLAHEVTVRHKYGAHQLTRVPRSAVPQ